MAPRRCKYGHGPMKPLYGDGKLRCPECTKQHQARGQAKRRGYPFCSNGHGLIPINTRGGVCGGCGEVIDVPITPADDWLDWALVYQALQGLPLVRPLTNYEVTCAIATISKRNSVGLYVAGRWLKENTHVDVPLDWGDYLINIWLPRRGLPLLTVTGAILRDYAIPEDDELDAA